MCYFNMYSSVMEIESLSYLDREVWSTDEKLKHWLFKSPLSKSDRGCGCKGKGNYVTLIDHDSCIRGRIDTTICKVCDVVVNLDIIR